MSDGNTTAPISPVVIYSEDQEPRTPVVKLPENPMDVRSIFQQAADTIVRASQLSEEVAQLRESVNGLRVDVETLRRTNHYLTEEIEDLREKRRTLQFERAQLVDENANLRLSNDSLVEQVNRLEKERDWLRGNLDEITVNLQTKVSEVEVLNGQVSSNLSIVEQTKQAVEVLTNENNRLSEQLTVVYGKLSDTESARDTHHYRVMELEDTVRHKDEQVAVLNERADRAEGRLSAIRSAIGG